MRKTITISVASSLLICAQPLAAQDALPSVPTAAQLALMCNPDGALDYRFGQKGVPFSSRLENDLNISMELPPSVAPFQTGNPFASKWSGAMFEMNYHWRDDSKDDRDAYMAELADAIDQAGWEPMPADEDPPMYRATYSGEFAWKLLRAADDARPDLYLSVSDIFGYVTLSCGRDDYLKRNAEEAFGKLPEGTPRPQPAAVDVPPIMTFADCAKPEIGVQLDAFFERGRPNDYLSALMSRVDYNERLTTWKMWKLENSGKITPERLLDVSMRGLEAGSAGGNILAHFSLIEEVFPLIERMAAQQKANDRDGMCRSFVDFNGLMGRMETATMKQSRSTQDALDAEAKRLGVSLD